MAAVQNFPDAVRDNFSVVTGQTVDLAATNIRGLRANQAGTVYFRTRIGTLPTAYIPDANDVFYRDGFSFSERLHYIGGGTYGQVFQGVTSGNAYKKMTMPPNPNPSPITNELYYREVYLEAFIQTVLQNDPMYGQNIGAIEKIYIDQMPDGSSRNIFYYQMETINNPGGLRGYLNSQQDPVTGLVPRATLLAILRQLATILEHFRRAYGFYHRDLHAGNIMFHDMTAELAGAAAGTPPPTDLLPGNRRIKIIDFGMSCMRPTTNTFSVEGNDCIALDLLIYIVSLFDYRDMFDAESITFLNGLFTKQIGGIRYNLYTMMNDYTRTTEHVPNFYLAYHYRINGRDRFWGRNVGVGRVTILNEFRDVWARFITLNFLMLLDYNFPVVFLAAAAAAPAAAAAASPVAASPAAASPAAASPAAASPAAAALPPLPPSGAVSSVTSGSPSYAVSSVSSASTPNGVAHVPTPPAVAHVPSPRPSPVAHVPSPRPTSANPGFFTALGFGGRRKTRRRKNKKQKKHKKTEKSRRR